MQQLSQRGRQIMFIALHIIITVALGLAIALANRLG